MISIKFQIKSSDTTKRLCFLFRLLPARHPPSGKLEQQYQGKAQKRIPPGKYAESGEGKHSYYEYRKKKCLSERAAEGMRRALISKEFSGQPDEDERKDSGDKREKRANEQNHARRSRCLRIDSEKDEQPCPEGEDGKKTDPEKDRLKSHRKGSKKAGFFLQYIVSSLIWQATKEAGGFMPTPHPGPTKLPRSLFSAYRESNPLRARYIIPLLGIHDHTIARLYE